MPDLILTVHSATKGVTLLQLIRSNILSAKGSCMKLTLGVQCWRKSTDDYENMMKSMKSYLGDKESPYAVANMIKSWLGPGTVDTLSKVAGLRTGPLGKRVADIDATSSQAKRPRLTSVSTEW